MYKWTNPGGTYYVAVESVFVCERSRNDPKQIKSIFVKAGSSTIDPAMHKRSYVEMPSQPFDLVQLLSDRKVRLPFFETWPESLGIDGGGVYVHDSDLRSYFVGPEEVTAWTGTEFRVDDGKPHVHEMLETGTSGETSEGFHLYLVVRAGWGRDDVGQLEAIIPTSHEKMRTALEDVQRQHAAREPRTLKR